LQNLRIFCYNVVGFVVFRQKANIKFTLKEAQMLKYYLTLFINKKRKSAFYLAI